MILVKYMEKIYISSSLLFLLSRFGHVQLCAALWTVACQAPLSMAFSRQEYWSGLPGPPPGHLPGPGIELVSPARQADSLPTDSPGKPYKCVTGKNKSDSISDLFLLLLLQAENAAYGLKYTG